MKIEFKEAIPHITPENKEEEDMLFGWYGKYKNKNINCCMSLNWENGGEADLSSVPQANELYRMLTAGAYLGSLIGRKVKVKPGFEFECRGYYLNDNCSGTLYGKKGHIAFQTIDDISPCR